MPEPASAQDPAGSDIVTIVVDAMGGDHAPRVPVTGAVQALADHSFNGRLLLVGDQAIVEGLLAETGLSRAQRSRIEVVHASQVIGMDESPSQALEKKKDASMLVGARLVKAGRGQALVSAGNPGALMAGSLLTLGRLAGIRRPAIAVLWPTQAGPPVLVLDSGANAECRPEYLLQFAHMGSVYMERVMGRVRPRIGLLNIGEEAGKGGALLNTAFGLLEKSGLEVTGNVEPRDLLQARVDVVVADGFMGNMILKTGEAVAEMMMNLIKSEVKKSLVARIGAMLMGPVFVNLKKKVDHTEHGGAPLLGLQAIVIKSHGRSDEKALCNAVHAAAKAVRGGVLGHIAESVRQIPTTVASPPNGDVAGPEKARAS